MKDKACSKGKLNNCDAFIHWRHKLKSSFKKHGLDMLELVSKNINQSVGMWELPCLKVSSLWKRWSEEGWLRMDSGKKKKKQTKTIRTFLHRCLLLKIAIFLSVSAQRLNEILEEKIICFLLKEWNSGNRQFSCIYLHQLVSYSSAPVVWMSLVSLGSITARSLTHDFLFKAWEKQGARLVLQS